MFVELAVESTKGLYVDSLRVSESRACTVRLTLLFGFIWDRLPRRIMWLKARCEYTARIGLNGTGAADRFVAYKLCVMVRVAFSRDHVSKHLSMAFWDARRS